MYTLATDHNADDKIVFRAAYVLEAIYFNYPQEFIPYADSFVKFFPQVKNSSAKRHFTKIMTNLLKNKHVSDADLDLIAQSCLSWITEPRVRVAVQIGSMEILWIAKERLDWLPEVLPEVMDILSRCPSPALQVRLRRWKTHKI